MTKFSDVDKFPVSGPAIGQAAGWNVYDMKAELSRLCPSELTEPDEPDVVHTSLVEEESVKTQSLRKSEEKREDDIYEAEAVTFLHLQHLCQLSPPLPAQCFQDQDGGGLIHLDKSSGVEGRTDKPKVTKAKVHPKSPVAEARAGICISSGQKVYLTEGCSQGLKCKDDNRLIKIKSGCFIANPRIDKLSHNPVFSAEIKDSSQCSTQLLNFVNNMFNYRVCDAELSQMEARGVYTAYLDSSRSMPEFKMENLELGLTTFDPGLDIWQKNCDQDLLGQGVTFSYIMESWAREWILGMVEDISKGRDGVLREVTVKYCNSSDQKLSLTGDSSKEKALPRSTIRTVRKMAAIVKARDNFEWSPHYDGHHTTVWEVGPRPEVISRDCECQTDVRE